MAKALSCLSCGTVRTLLSDGTTTFCDCGLVAGWWISTATALAKFHVRDPQQIDQAQVVLIHNGFLRAGHDMIPTSYRGPDGKAGAYSAVENDTFWRQVHSESQTAPRYPEAVQIFDRSRRGCPMVVQRPGETPDTGWATPTELRDRGLLPVEEPVSA